MIPVGGWNGMSAHDQGRRHATLISPWLRGPLRRSTETSDQRDEAEMARRAGSTERLALFIWIFFAVALFGFGMYALAVEARTRLGPLFVISPR
jgi:hypothetical protein